MFQGLLFLVMGPVAATGEPNHDPLILLDVPYIAQSQALCGGAAAAMVLRYWGDRGLAAESFAHLVDDRAAGIRTDVLIGELVGRGWVATGIRGRLEIVVDQLALGRPVIALIEERPGIFHYIVIVAARPTAIVFHDPARSPFRVMTPQELDRRWRAAGYWMAVVVPGRPVRAEDATVSRDSPESTTPCDWLVTAGVRHAQAGDLEAAERSLTMALACPGPAAVRELAGVRALQQRWSEVTALAGAAVAQDAADAHAWRLLATSLFLEQESSRALVAWNAIGEPRVDIVRIDGLTRTRQRVVERLIGVAPGEVLTLEHFRRARRRIGDLPSALSTDLTYVPVPGGRTEVRASISERSLMPSSVWSYAAVGLTGAVKREVEFTTGALSGGGERLWLGWRFWPERPRIGLQIQSTALGRGLWSADAFWERQPFDIPDLAPSERRAARVALSAWATSRVHWTFGAGLDRWERSGAFGVVGSILRYASHDDRVGASVGIDRWAGARPFASAHGVVHVRSSTRFRGVVWHAEGGAGVTTRHAPESLWFGGDTGSVRPVLLRAHPLLDGGRLRISHVGRGVLHGSAERRQWWQGPMTTQLGVGVFVDAVRVDHRIDPTGRSDVDFGAGARAAIPGLAGVFRIDVARGVRDGSAAVSLVFEPASRRGS